MNDTAWKALRETAAWFDLPGRGNIRVTGEDRARLLHAMCTNHIQELQPGTGCYAFFLTAQGRIITDANVFCMPDYLLLDTEPETRQTLLNHLSGYIIADDAALHDFTTANAAVALDGPGALEILNSLGALPGRLPYSFVEWNHRQIAHWSYTGGSGYMILLPAEDRDELVRQLSEAGAVEADLATADALRISNRRARYGVEVSEVNIPQETGQMQAVHFSKGCYLGQEIVERVRSRGHVNRQLTPVSISANTAPERGAKVLAGDKEVGEILSAAALPGGEVVGFAMLRAESLAGNAPLSAGGAAVTPR